MSNRRLAKGQYPDRDIKPRRDKRRWLEGGKANGKGPKRRCDDCGNSVNVYVNQDGTRTCDDCEYGRAS